jgi:hypothetical protein
MSIARFSDLMGNGTSDLLACGSVPPTTALSLQPQVSEGVPDSIFKVKAK